MIITNLLTNMVILANMDWVINEPDQREAVNHQSPPEAELWTLRVEDPTLILRKPLELPNLDFLLSQTNASATTNAPGK